MDLGRFELCLNIKLVLILFGFVLVMPLNGQTDTLKVLFIGNSYTYFNEMPTMLASLAQSANRPVITGQSTPGGYTLQQHTQDTTTISMISQGVWHYVVLQEQSQIPTIEYWRYNSMYPAARYLDSLIVEHNESTAFFMTWGRKYGGMQSYNGYSSPDFRDFFEMQEILRSAYLEIANELSATLCPVGMAWAQAKRIDTLVDLWQSDNSHPTLKGSYLTACVFYCVFFDTSPVGLSYTGGLSQEDALFCQTVAWQTVSDIDEPVPYLPSQYQFSIYPNPTNSEIHIRFPPAVKEIKIYNTSGQVIKSFSFETIYDKRSMENEIVWNRTNEQGGLVPAGIYFFRMGMPKNNFIKKVIFTR